MECFGSFCQSKELDTLVKAGKLYEIFYTYFTNVTTGLNLGVAEKDQ